MLVLSGFLISCGGGKEQGGNAENGNGEAGSVSGEVKIDGSSTVYPITEAVAEEFRNVNKDVRVTIAVSGTGGGFKKFGRGETDINNASKAINEEQKKLASENNINYVDLMVAYDGLAVVVNPKNDWAKDITVAELKKIWEPAAQEKITRWNQIRPEWPNEPLRLYGPGVESGTFEYFTEVVVGKAKSSRGDFTASEDDNVLVQGVSGDKFALGFFGLAYVTENKDKLKLVTVGGVSPSLETVRNKTYTPLSRPLYLYVSSAAVKKPAIKQFVDFYLENAEELSKEVGYIPLMPEEYNREKEKFKAFTSGNK